MTGTWHNAISAARAAGHAGCETTEGRVRMGETLNATTGSLLGFLHEEPMTGWDLVAVAQQRIGSFLTLTQSQVYRELAAMAKRGLVEAGRPGPRDRKPYAITEQGRAAFQAWIDQEPGLEQVRFPLLVTIMFAGYLPADRLAAMVAAHRAAHEERLASYEQAAGNVRADPTAHVSRLATLEFGMRYEHAVLDWFDRLPSILAVAAKRDPESPSAPGSGGEST